VATFSAGTREQVLEFGPYQLFRSQKTLLEDGRPVRLGSRATDILIALVERAGEVVTKSELITYAWPDTFVEENNLRVHVAAIRKILGDGVGSARYIINVTGRGYSFVAPVAAVDVQPLPNWRETKPRSALPSPLTRIVGREDAIVGAVAQLRRWQLTTIVGPGGVGKTTVGVAVAEQLVDEYGQRVYFVDLSAVDCPDRVPSALATVIGISALTDDPLSSLISYVRDARMLIVLDNCEHVIAVVAQFVEQLLRTAPEVKVLATSREPLLVDGEHVFQLGPLSIPPDDASPEPSVALGFPAIQLFVERAVSGLDSFELTAANAGSVVSICKRVDGIPLAIELIAARVNLFGVETLAQGFADNLLLVAKGKRTASSRQQSLRATLDWSYQILAPVEQLILRRLSVFRSAFSAESAIAIAGGADQIVPVSVIDGLMSLVNKSLIVTDVGGNTIRYRLLYITRAFATEMLIESGERAMALRAHAEHFRTLLEAALSVWETTTRSEWLARYGGMIDDVRAALDWAYGPDGNVELGAALTVASLPFGFQLSLIDEFKRRATAALESLAQLRPSQPVWEMRINNALVGLLHNTGAPQEAVLDTIERSLALARQSGVARNSIEPLMTQTFYRVELGEYQAALAAADELLEVAKRTDDSFAILLADRVGAQVNLNAGNYSRARLLAERVLRHPARSIPLVYGQVPIDRHVSMRGVLARICWVEGRQEQAQKWVAEGIRLAECDGPSTMCQFLALTAVPIAFWRGDLSAAGRLTDTLLEYARRYTFTRWSRLGLCYQLAAQHMAGMPVTVGLAPGESDNGAPVSTFQRDLLGTISALWLDAATVFRAERGQCGWLGPAILLQAGMTHAKNGLQTGELEAKCKYSRALELARAQGSVAWERCGAESLAELNTPAGWRGRA
jgi:predicted ATPase/DNA-binding winged helix-turn-helix (wHTH) protein